MINPPVCRRGIVGRCVPRVRQRPQSVPIPPGSRTVTFTPNLNFNGTAGRTIICPNNAGDRVIVSFSSFQVEASWDPLYVYNGPTQASPQIASTNGTPLTTPNFGAGGWWGTVAPQNTGIPGTVMSTDPSGCLTFVHISDGSVQQAGWTASVACVTPQYTCSTAGVIACGDTKTGFTIGGTNTLPTTAQCDFNGGPSTSGVSWWVYNAVADQDVTMSTCGGVMNTRISVFSGSCTNLTCVGAVDDGPGCPNGSTEVTFRALNGESEPEPDLAVVRGQRFDLSGRVSPGLVQPSDIRVRRVVRIDRAYRYTGYPNIRATVCERFTIQKADLAHGLKLGNHAAVPFMYS